MNASTMQEQELNRAYEGMLAAAVDIIPAGEPCDFSDLHLQFAVLRDALGHAPTERDLLIRSELAAQRGIFIDEITPIWSETPEVAKAVKDLSRHASVIGHVPAVQKIGYAYESAQNLGVSMKRAFGKHYERVTSHPRVQTFLRTVRDFVTRHIASAARGLQFTLNGVESRMASIPRDLAQALEGVQEVLKQADTALEATAMTSISAPFSRTAQAAHLRSSTSSDAPQQGQASSGAPSHRRADQRAATLR
ncbi:hypothetical protein GCM10009733_006290 [Nonomuraea maheshkhaliensis]|uniref:DUF2786 domain-containing protein n=1 Tax=Nonomuraea maheshkhaliensis TaxID=419590 RepID=A0ABN2ENV0_9ACTN